MALSQRLDLRHSQSLVMTPQLQQAIKLLQLSNIELAEYISGELQKNPLLERDDGDGPAAQEAGSDNLSAYDEARVDEERPSGLEDGFSDEVSIDAFDNAEATTLPDAGDDPNDNDYENNWGSAGIEETDGPTPGLGDDAGLNLGSYTGSGGRSDFDDSDFGLDQSAQAGKTLREHLHEQIGIDFVDPVHRMIGANLIEMIDDTGYFLVEMTVAAEALGCEVAAIETVFERMQKLDPPGVFARTLSECLTLQLKDRNRFDPAIEALVNNLDRLARRDIAGLKKLCGVDDEDIAEMIGEIKSLDPKPGLAFESIVDEQIVPDVLMRAGHAGDWILELNPDSLPRVLVNNSYLTSISKRSMNKTDREYLSECQQSANWLVRSLHQRATTILKVAGEIIRQQDEFFRFGVQYLKPLVLRDIAEVINMHESTVSRVTNNKYIATPRGLLELKYFFTSAIASAAGGEAHSAESVRFRIKALIDEEPADKVLSDDRLVEILRGQGVDIARRTVAKYRESMRIPSSVHRRREKAIAY
ncbi:RNA polymerase factor sigma-54 [Ponticaulis sp.]|uniref:RNA polymerase factor sigma-54 n=1 Tax=Ponticaulis sp. TaxID=2020902 RepID=UPI000C40496B|nr:RNA polymerase factor sigma-54 [Ponticaulis sp.]MBN06138.1 RNA polymerase sigma-54 factor [Ponticaulis sp.]